MKTINRGGCARGCEYLYVLPFDSKPSPLHANVLRVRNDTSAVLSLSRIPLDQMEIKKAA